MKEKRFRIPPVLAAILCTGLFFHVGLPEASAVEPGGETSSGVPAARWQPLAMDLDEEYEPTRVFQEMGDISSSGDEPQSALAWLEIMGEDFEVLFPQYNAWQTFNSVGYAPYYWGKSSYLAHGGTYSGWCAGAHRTGNPDLDPALQPYPNDMKGWMIWGPFSLSDASDAELLFYYWINSEEGYDFLGIMASANGTNFYGVSTSGNSGGWVGQEAFDLTDVYTLGNLTGQPNVWIAFVFTSDYSTTTTGAFLDDIVLRKEVTNAPPVISHTPVTTATAGQNTAITATITDDAAVTGAALYYRRGGDSSYSTVAMTAAGEIFSGTIPGASVTSRGLEYYLSATDGTNISFSPVEQYVSSPHVVRVQVDNLVKTGTQTGGSEQTAYRMFSVPLELEDPSVEAVLADDLGSYNDTQWRFFRYQNAAWNEHPDAGDIEPGQAFWLIVRESDKTIDAGAGTSVSTSDSFEITLHPGWNDIGLPFDFPVSWSSVRADTISIDGPYAYVDQWILPQDVTDLSPWSGYALNNLSGSDVIIKIPPILGIGASGATEPGGPFAGRGDIQWFVRMRAYCGQARDENNYLGCSPKASRERDRLDLSEPPPVGEHVSLYFPHPEWALGTDRFTVDFRPPGNRTEVWDLAVCSNQPGAFVQLEWDIDSSLPPDLDMKLIDLCTEYSVNMRKQTHYRFISEEDRSFQLVVGPAKIVHETGSSLPGTWRLDQNHPNPFNPFTTIGFELMHDSHVELSIYNVLGERVQVLCCERLSAGYHQVPLDARNLSSGVYFYRLEAGTFTAIKKMVLLR